MAIRQRPGYSGTKPIRPSFKTKGKQGEFPQRYGAVVVLMGPVKPKAPKRLTA
jgi:hypothetical protein